MDDNETPSISLSIAEDDIRDCTFHVSDMSSTLQAEPAGMQSDSIRKEAKFIVFDSCLMDIIMMMKCGHWVGGEVCGEPLINVTRAIRGTNLKIHATCTQYHPFSWSAQPMLGQLPAGNLLCAAAALFSGSSFKKLQYFFQFVGIHFIAKTQFYKYQTDYLFPAISEAWRMEKMSMESTFAGKRFRLAGDGQCDSPGFSAKYCTYHFQDMESKKIVSSVVVQVSQSTSSVAMEKVGFVASLQELQSRGMVIDLIATDRHVSIAKTMREEYKNINHQFDVWHLAKTINKKLSAAGKKKNTQGISQWSKSISNHLWWSSKTCEGSLEILLEKWRSVMLHCSNVHRWSTNEHFHKCEHGHLSTEEARKKKWLIPSSPTHKAIEKIVFDKAITRDLRGLTEFCHTGDLEVFHNMCLKYRPKRLHFGMEGMINRTLLAVLAHNHNVGRQQSRTTGTLGKLRYNKAFTKRSKQWVIKPVFEDMQYEFIERLIVDVLDRHIHGVLNEPMQGTTALPPNIASVPCPPKAELIEKYTSRFK
ncbi:uncharacterized protein [Ambystoma mexicanum]